MKQKIQVFKKKKVRTYLVYKLKNVPLFKVGDLFLQQNFGKKNIYNLNEDEELTHYGQSLADIEKLNDIVDSDSDAEERGALSGK